MNPSTIKEATILVKFPGVQLQDKREVAALVSPTMTNAQCSLGISGFGGGNMLSYKTPHSLLPFLSGDQSKRRLCSNFRL